MRRVGDLVGIDADQPRLDARHQPVQVVRLEGRLRRRRPARPAAPAGRRSRGGCPSCISKLSDWLSCIAIERASATGWPSQFARQVLLVAAVAGLVHRAHQAAEEVVLAKARGQAHVLGHAAAERVRAHVEPAGLEVEAEQARSRARTGAAARPPGTARPAGSRASRRLALAHLADQPRQPVRARRRRRGRPWRWSCPARSGPSARRSATGRCCSDSSAASSRAMRQHLAEVAEEALPVVGRALRAPGMLAARAGQLAALHQRLGQRIGALPVAPDLAQVGALQLRQRPPARRAAMASASAGSVRMRCSSAAISASAAARAALPLGGIFAAWSQPASDCRCPRRCSRV